MTPQMFRFLLLAASGLCAGCDQGRVHQVLGLATPTPTPTPAAVVTRPSTPKPGAWMWEKRGRTMLDAPPSKR